MRLRPEQLLGRHGEVLRAALVLEVDAVAVHAEDEVGEGIEQRPDARLGLGERGEAALVLERERGGRGDRLDEQRVLLERAVVDERRHRLARRARPSSRAPRRAASGSSTGSPSRSANDSRLGDPVGEAQRRVAERAGERLAQLARRVRLPQLEHELADALPGQAAADGPDDERDRDAGEGDDETQKMASPALVRELTRGQRDGEEDEGRARGQVDGGEHAPERHRGGLPAAPEDVERREERRDPTKISIPR